MKQEKSKPVYGPSISQQAKMSNAKIKHATKLEGFIQKHAKALCQKGAKVAPSGYKYVSCEVEAVHEKTLHFVVFCDHGSEGPEDTAITLGHETIRLPRGYSIDKWDENRCCPRLEFTYVPLIGSIVYSQTVFKLPSERLF